MRALIVPAVATALLVSAGYALAADTATGIVKTINLSAMTLSLDNGSTFHLPSGWNDSAIKVGEKVMVTYKDSNTGQEMATAIVAAK